MRDRASELILDFNATARSSGELVDALHNWRNPLSLRPELIVVREFRPSAAFDIVVNVDN